MRMEAEFSPDRKYRYSLERIWDESCPNRFMVIGLNPSTADEKVDDPTIRRCVGFASSTAKQFKHRFGGLVMLNLFALRSRDPRLLLSTKNPEGFPGNSILRLMVQHPGSHKIVAAWGVRGHFHNRDQNVRRILYAAGKILYTFGLTKDKHPKHPLYLPSSTTLKEWPYDYR